MQATARLIILLLIFLASTQQIFALGSAYLTRDMNNNLQQQINRQIQRSLKNETYFQLEKLPEPVLDGLLNEAEKIFKAPECVCKMPARII